jgi:hypothetical protein
MYTVEQYVRVRGPALIDGKSRRTVAGSLGWREGQSRRCCSIRGRWIIYVSSRCDGQAGPPESSECWNTNTAKGNHYLFDNTGKLTELGLAV